MIIWCIFPIWLQCLVAVIVLTANVVHAAEYQRDENVAPESVKDEKDGIEVDSEEDTRLLPKLGDWKKGLPEFWSESSLTPHFRAYSFSRKFSDAEDPEAIALGGQLKYLSGMVKDVFRIGASYYISHGIHDNGVDGTLLLGPDESDLNVLGQLYLEALVKDYRVRLYRQTFNLPYLNKHDSRMIPITHQAYVVSHTGDTMEFIAGQVTHLKQRDSENFISMAEAAGVGDPDRGGQVVVPDNNKSDRGTSMAGLRYDLGDNTSVGAINYYTWDTFNIFYSDLHFLKEWNEEIVSRFSGQFTHQKSVGGELIGAFDTNQYGVKVRTSYKNAILTLAATNTGSGAPIQSPFGGRPSYLSLMRSDFDSANEIGFLVGLSYNFSRLGLPELSAFTNIAWGNNAEDTSTKENLPDETEYDFTVDYRPKSGILNGLWLRLRYAYLDQGDGEDTQDVRVIVNYKLPF